MSFRLDAWEEATAIASTTAKALFILPGALSPPEHDIVLSLAMKRPEHDAPASLITVATSDQNS